MNKNLLCLLFFSLLLLSCKKDDPTDDLGKKQLTLLGESVIDVPAEGRTVTISYELTNASIDDMVENATTERWLRVTETNIHISSKDKKLQGHTACRVSENDTNASREGKIEFTCGNQMVEVTIRQAGK